MRPDSNNRLLVSYYDATVVFLAIDFGLGINIRLSFLENAPVWRAAYYALLIGFAVLMRLRPDLRLLIGGVEGLVTMIGLIFGMYLGYTMSGVTSGSDMIQVLLNYAISGFFAYKSWEKVLRSLGAMT